MPRGYGGVQASDEQEPTPNRREPPAPEHVFRESLKKHAAHKAVYFEGNSIQRTDVRRVGLSRLQFGDVEHAKSLSAADLTKATSLPQMEEPVLVHRTMSRTSGLFAFSRRRTQSQGHGHGYGESDDSVSSASDSEDDSEGPFGAAVWNAGIGGFTTAVGPHSSSASSSASTGAQHRRPSQAMGLDDLSLSVASGARPYASSPLAPRPGSRPSIAGGPDAGGTAGLPPNPDPPNVDGSVSGDSGYPVGASGGGEADSSGRLLGVQDRPGGRVDQLLENLRKDDPRGDALLYIGAPRMRRSSRRDSSSSSFEPARVLRSRSVTAAQIFQLDQQALAADIPASEALRGFGGGGGGGGGTASGSQSPLPTARSVQSSGVGGGGGGGGQGRFRRGSTLTDGSARWGPEGQDAVSLAPATGVALQAAAGRAPSRAGSSHLLQQHGSGLVPSLSVTMGSSPSGLSPLATAAAEIEYTLQQQQQHQNGGYIASPTSSSKLLRITEDTPFMSRASTHGAAVSAACLSPRASTHGQARPAHLSPTPHATTSMPGTAAPQALGVLRRLPSRSSSQRSLEALARNAAGPAAGGGAKATETSPSTSSRRLSLSPYAANTTETSPSTSSRRMSMSPYAANTSVSPLGRGPASPSQQELRQQLQQAASARAAGGLSASADLGSGGEGRMLGMAASSVSIDGGAASESSSVRLPSLSFAVGLGQAGSRSRMQ